MDRIRIFLNDTSGATAIEYAMIATLVSIVIVSALLRIGTSLNLKFYGPIGTGLN